MKLYTISEIGNYSNITQIVMHFIIGVGQGLKHEIQYIHLITIISFVFCFKPMLAQTIISRKLTMPRYDFFHYENYL